MADNRSPETIAQTGNASNYLLIEGRQAEGKLFERSVQEFRLGKLALTLANSLKW